VRLAREMGIVLVAEGIETEGELRAARQAGVPLGQGFLLGVPADAPLPANSVSPAAARAAAALARGSLRPRPAARRRGLHPAHG
jgi:EAL domain-containing protein (putative c-di-GMP-specific phosphodiesterase class I)